MPRGEKNANTSGAIILFGRLGLNVALTLGSLIFCYMIVRNHNIRRDMTESRMFSLSPQTEQYLKGLGKTIHVTAFTNTPADMRRFFDPYQALTERLIVTVRNPFEDFREAQRLRDEFLTELSPGDIFIQCGERRKKIRDMTESAFVNALVEVQREEDITAFFLAGHGEGTLEEPTEEERKRGASTFHTLKNLLLERGMQVKSLEIARTGAIPAEAKLLICAGPRTDILPLERRVLDDYMQRGGRMLLFLDPSQNPAQPLSELRGLLEQYGFRLEDEIVMDPNRISMERFGLPVVPLVTTYVKHPVTEDLPHGQYALFLPLARPVNPTKAMPSLTTFYALMRSGDQAWSLPMEDMLREKISPPDKEKIGPQTLAAAVTRDKPGGDESQQTRLIVFGDSDAFTDINAAYQMPLYLFMNSVAWLTQTADLVAVPPKMVKTTPLVIPPDQMRLWTLCLALLAPGLVLFGGLGRTLYRRRTR